MAHSKDKSKGGSRFTGRRYALTTAEANPARSVGAPNYEFYELEAAEVIDIILDDTHPDFNDYTDIGRAKIRFITSEEGKDAATLTYARPMDVHVKVYPVLHEIVIGVKYLGDLYYTQKLNVYNNPNENSFPGVSLPELSRGVRGDRKAADYEEVSSTGTPNVQGGSDEFKLGDVFEANSTIKPVKPREGDFILEGRFGNSIKLGSNPDTGKPNMRIKVGQPTDVPEDLLATIDENINDDPNSIWITVDEIVGLNPATIESDVHLQFYDDKPNEFIGNQIFMNSDRIVLNSKVNEIMGFAKKAMNLVTEGIFTIDSVSDTVINTATQFIVNTPKVLLGSPDAEEQMMLGTSWKAFMEELIDLLVNHKHPTGTGPSGPAMPPEGQQIQQLKSKLEGLLSQQNYTV